MEISSVFNECFVLLFFTLMLSLLLLFAIVDFNKTTTKKMESVLIHFVNVFALTKRMTVMPLSQRIAIYSNKVTRFVFVVCCYLVACLCVVVIVISLSAAAVFLCFVLCTHINEKMCCNFVLNSR